MAGRRTAAAVGSGDAHLSDLAQDWRKLNTGRLFYEGFELYNAALLNSLRSGPFSGIRNTHLNLLRHLDAEGTRMSDLARRSNLTRAAITGLVRACEQLDLVTVVPSSEDARARLVKFSPRGRELMRHIRRMVRVIERRLLDRLGDETYGNLRAALLSVSSVRDAL